MTPTTPNATAIIATLGYIEPTFCCSTYKELVDLTNEIMDAYDNDYDLAKFDEEFIEVAREKAKHECRKE